MLISRLGWSTIYIYVKLSTLFRDYFCPTQKADTIFLIDILLPLSLKESFSELRSLPAILEWRAAWDATAPQHQQDFILFLVQHEKLGFFRIGQLHHKLLRWAPGCTVRSSSLNQNVLVVVADKLLGKKEQKMEKKPM